MMFNTFFVFIPLLKLIWVYATLIRFIQLYLELDSDGFLLMGWSTT